MTPITINVELERVAKKSGGDRYKGITHNGEEFVVYFPQSISRREDHNPAQSLTLTIEEVE